MLPLRRHLQAFPNARLRSLLFGWLLVGTAGWALMVALAVYAFDRSGVAALGFIMAARLLPPTLAAPCAGIMLDRFPRHRVAGIACLAQAGGLAGVAVLMATDGPLWAVAVAAALSSAASSAPRPGLEALLPALADTPAELIARDRVTPTSS